MKILFTEKELCPSCKMGHLKHKGEVISRNPIVIKVTTSCDRCLYGHIESRGAFEISKIIAHKVQKENRLWPRPWKEAS